MRFLRSNALLVGVAVGAVLTIAASVAFVLLLAWPVEPVQVKEVILYDGNACPREQITAGLRESQAEGYTVESVTYRSEWVSLDTEPALGANAGQTILPASVVTLTDQMPHFEAVRTLPGLIAAPVMAGRWQLRVTVDVSYRWFGISREQRIVSSAKDALRVTYDDC